MTSMDSHATTAAQSDSSQETYTGGDAPSHDHGDPATPTLRDPRDWQTFQSLEVCAEYFDELRENLQPSPRGSVDSNPQTIDDRLRDAIRSDRRVVQIVDVDEHLAHTESCVFSRFRWRMEHGLIQMAYGNGCDANKHIPIRLPVMQKVRRRGGTPSYVHSVCRRCTACCFLHIDILTGSEPLAPVHGDAMQELKETMNSVQQTIKDIQRTVDDHSTRIDNISSASAPVANGDVQQLQEEITACSNGLKNAMTTLSMQAGRIDGIAATTQAAYNTLNSLTAKVNSIVSPFPFYPGYNGAQHWTSQQQTPISSMSTSAPAQTTQAASQPPRSFASLFQPSGSDQNHGNVTRSMPQPTNSSQQESIFLQDIPVTSRNAQQQRHQRSDNPASTTASHEPRQADPPPSPVRSAAQAMISMANSEEEQSSTRASKVARRTRA